MTKVGSKRKAKRLTYLTLEFIDDKHVGTLYASTTRKKALEKINSDRLARVLVLPTKGRASSRVTHDKWTSTSERTGKVFFAVITPAALRQKYALAAEAWANDKAARRAKAATALAVSKVAPFEELPLKLQARIKIQDDGCWLWCPSRRRNKRGVFRKYTKAQKTEYGRIRFGGKTWAAHRLTFTVLRCEIPEGLYVCHGCDTRACVNPSHHFLGTEEDNFRDMIQKKRAAWQT